MTTENNKPIAVAVVSGGMDSVTLAYLLIAEGYAVKMISFNYGQRHSKELEMARWQAGYLGLSHEIVDISKVGRLMKGSSLTDNIAVPHGHYAAENMKLTVVPNRNMIMFSIAGAWAVSLGAEIVATAVHAGDHFIYPDCRPQFIKSLDTALRLGNEGFANKKLELIAPFINMGKHQICVLGNQLGVRYDKTWSCYEGGEKHCGKCGTCVERKEAFLLAGYDDPTEYSDPDVLQTEMEL